MRKNDNDEKNQWMFQTSNSFRGSIGKGENFRLTTLQILPVRPDLAPLVIVVTLDLN